MSHSLPPLSLLSRIPQNSQKRRETYLPSLDMLTGYRRHQSILSSSPIRSSSPPRTPYLPGYGHYQPYIQSSPLLDGNVELPPLRYRADDPPSIWAKPGRKFDNHLPASLMQASIGRGRHSSYFDDEELPPSSDFEMGREAEDAEMSTPELESETAGQSTPGHEIPSLSFSDSESEQHSNSSSNTTDITHKGVPEGDDGNVGFGDGGWRATFFQVSEERGRWKDDPVALKPTTTAGLRRPRRSRQSMPALPTQAQSKLPSVGPLTIATRTISEPLASASSKSTLGGDRRDLIPTQPATTVDSVEGAIAVQDPQLKAPEPEQGRDILPSASSQSNSRSQTPNHEFSSSDRPEHGNSEVTQAGDPVEEAEVEEEAEPRTAVTENYGNGYSSPLPPSSPPLSPMSGCEVEIEELEAESFSRLSSPLSFLPSSPSVSEGMDLDLDNVELDGEEAQNGEGLDERDDEMAPAATHEPETTFASALFGTSIPSSRPLTSNKTLMNGDIAVIEEPVPTSGPSSVAQSRPTTLAISGPAANASTSKCQPIPSSSSSTPISRTELKPMRSMTPVPDIQEGLASPSTSMVVGKGKGKHARRESQGSEKENASWKGKAKAMDVPMTKRKTVAAESLVNVDSFGSASRPSKKRKTDSSEEVASEAAKAKVKKTKSKGKERESQDIRDVEMHLEDEQEPSAAMTAKSKKRKSKVAPDAEFEGDHDSSSKPSTTASKARKANSSLSRKRKSAADSGPSVPAEPEPFDGELEGMLIEVLATSRASSLSVSVLCRSVLQAHPYLKEDPVSEDQQDVAPTDTEKAVDMQETERKPCPYPYLKNRKSDKSWKGVVQRVLLAGTVEGGGSGVFGKVDSSGKDDSDRPLEAQWFYVPESDQDQDRAALLRSLMPRPAKRSETKKYKQYYWRPLDKISRWDREDDL